MNMLKLSTVLIMGFVSLTLIMGCSRTAEQKIADAKADVTVAKQDVKDAVADAQTAAEREDWLAFKGAAEIRIAVNDKSIAEYKLKMTAADGKQHAEYDKRIDALELKNKELRARLDKYPDGGKNTWEQFKSEFSHDMDELGSALKDFAVDNKK
jgi:hypothetical protein